MIKIFGIKNCDTVRKALKWLDSNNANYEYHDFRKDGLDADLALTLVKAVDTNLLINRRGTTWRKLDDKMKNTVDKGCQETILRLIQTEPAVIKRPVWCIGGETIIGFKQPEIDKISQSISCD